MISCGIDMGGGNIKVLILNDGKVVGKSMVETELDRLASGKKALDVALQNANMNKSDLDYIVATGAGRKIIDFADKEFTTVACDARGIISLYPDVKTVIDIGADEARSIKCDDSGKVVDFALNEKCAAGSGAFVAAMARAMQVSQDEFASFSLQSTKSIPINAQCAIFAESEVVSLVHEETDRADICKAVHDAIAARIASMARRIRIEEKVALIGGVAKNKGFLDSLKRELKVEFIVPADPDFVGALGAALLAG